MSTGHVGADALLRSVDDPKGRLLDAVVDLVAVEGGLAELAPVLAEVACYALNVDGASVSTVVGSNTVTLATTGTLSGAKGIIHPREGSLVGAAIASAQPQVCADTRTDSRVQSALPERLGIRSIAIMPIRHAHQTFALLTVADADPGAITEQHVDFLLPLLRVASLRLARADAEKSATDQLAMLRDVTETSRQLLVADDPTKCLIDAAIRIGGAQHVYVWEPAPEPGQLRLTRFHGYELPADLRIPADSASIAGGVFAASRPRVIPNWTTHPDVDPSLANAIMEGEQRTARSGVFLPLTTADGAIGVLVALLPQTISIGNMEMLGLLGLLASEAGVAMSRDRMRRTLSEQARTDPLTGLANRRVWAETLDRELSRAARTGSTLSLAMIDLDHFKRFNDSFGHAAGDLLLQEVAQVWSGSLRPTDLLARLGGEEFALLLPDTDLVGAEVIAARLMGAVPHGQTASFGLTTVRTNETGDAAMHRADKAVYAAKGAGRNQVVTR